VLEDGEAPCDELMLFKTRVQTTWLFFTNKHIVLLLDDLRDRTKLFKWRMVYQDIRRNDLHAYKDDDGANRIDFGEEQPEWRFSHSLHPKPRRLEKDIWEKISKCRAKNSVQKPGAGKRGR
jgi:hypothetical protein